MQKWVVTPDYHSSSKMQPGVKKVFSGKREYDLTIKYYVKIFFIMINVSKQYFIYLLEVAEVCECVSC